MAAPPAQSSQSLLDFDWKLIQVCASSDAAAVSKPLLRLQLFVGALIDSATLRAG
jgi:hypothetical protein